MLLLLAVAAAVLAAPGGASARGDALRLVQVASFDQPVYATATTSEPARLYVVEQPGRVLVLEHGKVRDEAFLDIRDLVKSGGEQGLLSLAFSPTYAKDRLFYVDYTDRNGDTHVVRYRSDGTRAIRSSARQLLFVKDFAANHNGGQLQFGPDGWLWWGNGDGGGAGDPESNGQSLARPFAKLMRRDVADPRSGWRLVAYGLRNPWRFSFDRASGDLYIGDVGQNAWEEIDFLRHGFATPVNLGWRRWEGLHLYDESQPLLDAGRYVPPVVEYPHDDGCSVTGGYVYRGELLPAQVGRYFYGDYCSATVWSLRMKNGRATDVRREAFTVAGLSSFAEDAAGELYAMSVSTGRLYRIAD
jgi:glucose/arabinose dehydrogenase